MRVLRFPLAVLLAALLIAPLARGVLPTDVAQAAPARQTVTLLVLGFVDVAGENGGDPDCPGCNGEFDAEDEQVAMTDPLPSMTFVARDESGAEVARVDSVALAGLQRASFELPAGAGYTVELVADPAGWTLCSNSARVRTVSAGELAGGSARLLYFFTKGCGLPGAPTATPVPGAPTATPGQGPTAPPPAPADDDDDDDDDRDEAGPLGYLKGMTFVDRNASGAFEAGEPGLNDVKVSVHGGGHEFSLITDGSGLFSFDGLGAGRYDVFIDPGPEWKVTTPRKYAGVHVAGDVVRGIDFGLIRHSDLASTPAPAAPAPDVETAPVAPEAPRLVAPAPGAGIRLPQTGVADLPPGRWLAAMAGLLGLLAAAGFSTERWHGWRS